MAIRYKPMLAYSAPAAPMIPGGELRFIIQELTNIQNVLTSTQTMIPQEGIASPNMPPDGIQRLARAPWWPVAGQSADAWVYFDGVARLWRFMSTAPTNTGA